MNPALRSSAAHVFVQSLTHIELAPDDDHHLRRVLRLRPSERITISDGAGSWLEAEMGAAAPEVVRAVHVEPPHTPRTVAAAIPKGDRLEWMVQKLTELGVDRIVLVECERSVVRWDAERAAKQLVRLRRIAREAASQSRRVWLPELATARFGDLVESSGVALAEPGGAPLLPSTHTVVVGPEGGFAAAELANDLPRVALADTVLRVETAAIVAAAALAAR